MEVDDAFHQELYEAYPFCISKHTESDVHGTTNFVLPVYDSEDKVAFCVWGLDTNNLISEYDDMVPSGDMCKSALLPQMPVGKGRWSIPHFDQLMWYWNTSRALEAHCGKKIPGMLCMHMPLYEYITAAANPEICVKDGVHGEPADPGFLNCGLFAEILQRGDIKTIGCGHTHCNDYEAEYCGIKLCWDGCAGYTAYGIDERRGGRVFEFYEDRSFEVNTYMIHTQKMMEEES